MSPRGGGAPERPSGGRPAAAWSARVACDQYPSTGPPLHCRLAARNSRAGRAALHASRCPRGGGRGVRRGQRVLDVGCGPGALTAELVGRAGAHAVSAVEPSASFAAAVRERLPGVDVRRSAAEALPFPDGAFDAALAQLVVHFMADPVRGLREMGRVPRPGGMVAACVWDHAGGRGPLTAFWSAVRDLDPAAADESDLAGAREGHL